MEYQEYQKEIVAILAMPYATEAEVNRRVSARMLLEAIYFSELTSKTLEHLKGSVSPSRLAAASSTAETLVEQLGGLD